jgi:tungstate transport system ATP-binding protein
MGGPEENEADREPRPLDSWVTHDRDEAVAVADAVTFLSDGQVRQTGPGADVFTQPRTTEIAHFLGLESYIDGEVVLDGDVARLMLSEGTSIVRAEAEPGPGLGCLFPEDVVLLRRPPEEGGSSLRNVAVSTTRLNAPRTGFITNEPHA